jgi:hypothetical protein
MYITLPMLFQHSRSQARIKEEGCVRLDKPTTILAIYIKMKPHEKSLGRNPLNDATYQNPGMVLNR